VSPSGKASGFHPDTRGFDPRLPLISLFSQPPRDAATIEQPRCP
jgi:hypothetical protein